VLASASKGGGKAGGGRSKGGRGQPNKKPAFTGFGPPVSRVKKAVGNQLQPASFLSSPISVELQVLAARPTACRSLMESL